MLYAKEAWLYTENVTVIVSQHTRQSADTKNKPSDKISLWENVSNVTSAGLFNLYSPIS